jgi:hypothetical protein
MRVPVFGGQVKRLRLRQFGRKQPFNELRRGLHTARSELQSAILADGGWLASRSKQARRKGLGRRATSRHTTCDDVNGVVCGGAEK